MESAEKLDKLLSEGKITQEEYWELYKNISKSTPQDFLRLFIKLPGAIPWQIWFCVIFLFIVAIIDVALPPYHLGGVFAAFLCLILSYGLVKQSRIAYVVLFLIGLATIFLGISSGSLLGMVLNTIFMVILFSVWKWFFIGRMIHP